MSEVIEDLASRDGIEKNRESEALLRLVAAQARVGLVMVDTQKRYLFANATFAEMFRLPNADVVGKLVSEVLPDIYSEVEPRLNRALGGERVVYELNVPGASNGSDDRCFEVSYEPRGVGHEAYVVVVIVDITERKRVQEKLEQLVSERTAKLQETIQELEAFSYSIAHDMRAPLRSMHGFANIVVEDYGDALPEEAKNYLERISSSASRLDRLIQDVLQYSRIVRQSLPLQVVDVEPLIREIVETYPQLHAPGVKIDVQGPMPRVWANVAALTQIVSNLLGNAVKFVAPGTEPRVRVRSEMIPCAIETKEHSGCVRLWFEDNGIGIGKEWHGRIFGMFHRLNPANSYEGTGIGLAIVRKAAERMGGRVGLESELGKGSRFWVELKLPPSA